MNPPKIAASAAKETSSRRGPVRTHEEAEESDDDRAPVILHVLVALRHRRGVHRHRARAAARARRRALARLTGGCRGSAAKASRANAAATASRAITVSTGVVDVVGVEQAHDHREQQDAGAPRMVIGQPFTADIGSTRSIVTSGSSAITAAPPAVRQARAAARRCRAWAWTTTGPPRLALSRRLRIDCRIPSRSGAVSLDDEPLAVVDDHHADVRLGSIHDDLGVVRAGMTHDVHERLLGGEPERLRASGVEPAHRREVTGHLHVEAEAGDFPRSRRTTRSAARCGRWMGWHGPARRATPRRPGW